MIKTCFRRLTFVVYGQFLVFKKRLKYLSNPAAGYALSLLVLLTTLVSCNSDYTPKPRGYFQIHFPKKQYQPFNQPGYPYSFEYLVYANIVKDNSCFGGVTENPWCT